MDHYGFLAVCAAWINYMKTYLTEEQFRAILKEMADHFRYGTPFDGNALEVLSYKAVLMGLIREAVPKFVPGKLSPRTIYGSVRKVQRILSMSLRWRRSIDRLRICWCFIEKSTDSKNRPIF